MAIKLVQ